jgi:hypothetical protein
MRIGLLGQSCANNALAHTIPANATAALEARLL